MSEETFDRLNFEVRLHGERLTASQWLGIARRIAKAAKGRSKFRSVVVYAGDSSVTINEDGSFTLTVLVVPAARS